LPALRLGGLALLTLLGFAVSGIATIWAIGLAGNARLTAWCAI
jgi:hypothetical protein